MTLKMTTAQVVKTSVTVTNSSFQNYTHPDNHTRQTTDTLGFKPITMSLPFIMYFLLTSSESIAKTNDTRSILMGTFGDRSCLKITGTDMNCGLVFTTFRGCIRGMVRERSFQMRVGSPFCYAICSRHALQLRHM